MTDEDFNDPYAAEAARALGDTDAYKHRGSGSKK